MNPPSAHGFRPHFARSLFSWGFAALVYSAASIWAVETLVADKLVMLVGHNHAVKKLAWSPSGRLISGDSDGNVFVWDPTKKSDLHHFKAGFGFIRSLETFDGAKRYVVTVNSGVIIGSIATGRQIEKMSEQSGGAFNYCAATTPDGKTVSVIVNGPTIVHYSSNSGKATGVVSPPSPASSICYTQDGRMIAGASSGREVWVFEPGKSKPSFTIPLSVGRCEDIRVSPDGRWLAAIGSYSAQVLQIKAGADPQKLEVGDKNLEALAWSADSEFVITAGAGGLVQFWERRSGKLKKQLQLGVGQSSALACSPDGQWLAIGGGDYVDMTKAPPRQEIDDKSIRLLELPVPAKIKLASTMPKGATATEVAIRLRTLQQQFDSAVARAGGDVYRLQLQTLRKGYLTKLESEGAQAAKAGKLELAVALRDEKSQAQKAPVLPTLSPNVAPEVQKLRADYDAQIQASGKSRMTSLQPLFDRFDQALGAYQDELTKRQLLEDALQVKERREKLAEERKADSPP